MNTICTVGRNSIRNSSQFLDSSISPEINYSILFLIPSGILTARLSTCAASKKGRNNVMIIVNVLCILHDL
ncbi:MAG: hypothetical protein ACI94Y_004536 [Maribacter sp.]|jgi:hypothetical protein